MRNSVALKPSSIPSRLKSKNRVLGRDNLEDKFKTIPKKTQTITLPNMNLSTFPSQLLGFTSLKYLDLGENNIEYIPTEISQLTKLKVPQY